MTQSFHFQFVRILLMALRLNAIRCWILQQVNKLPFIRRIYPERSVNLATLRCAIARGTVMAPSRPACPAANSAIASGGGPGAGAYQLSPIDWRMTHFSSRISRQARKYVERPQKRTRRFTPLFLLKSHAQTDKRQTTQLEIENSWVPSHNGGKKKKKKKRRN